MNLQKNNTDVTDSAATSDMNPFRYDNREWYKPISGYRFCLQLCVFDFYSAQEVSKQPRNIGLSVLSLVKTKQGVYLCVFQNAFICSVYTTVLWILIGQKMLIG